MPSVPELGADPRFGGRGQYKMLAAALQPLLSFSPDARRGTDAAPRRREVIKCRALKEISDFHRFPFEVFPFRILI